METPRANSLAGPGTSNSPISVSSSSPSPSSSVTKSLPRPPANVHYTSPLPRTAFTPPKATVVKAQHQAQTQYEAKPVHPFFSRDSKRSRSVPLPPPSQKPRLVAHYSSTEYTESDPSNTASASTSQQASQEVVGEGSRWVVNDVEIELLSEGIEAFGDFPGEGEGRKMEREEGFSEREEEVEEDMDGGLSDETIRELAEMLDDMVIPPRQRSIPRRPPLHPAGQKPFIPPPSLPVEPSRPPLFAPSLPTHLRAIDIPARPKTKHTLCPSPHLPLFSHRYLPSPPQVILTSSPSEANDHLSCLEGPVLGFDMEWPTAYYKEDNGQVMGRKWDPSDKVWKYIEPKTALMQFCDERMVVLVQVWGMDALPSKAVEILQDDKIYKVGVQIRGDAQKLLRDNHVFPESISSLLELSLLARKVDPIRTGPGRTLISLANLASTYLNKALDKSKDIRAGGWHCPLSGDQIDYAANDVFASLQIFLALQKLGRANGILVNLQDCCSNVNASQAKRSTTSTSTSTPIASSIAVPIGVTPAQMRAVEAFRQGTTIVDYATENGIKASTAQGYICKALILLPSDTLSTDQKTRLLAEIDGFSYTAKAYRKLLRRLRVELGQVVSDSENGGDVLP